MENQNSVFYGCGCCLPKNTGIDSRYALGDNNVAAKVFAYIESVVYDFLKMGWENKGSV